MRINKLTLENFRKFEHLELDLHPQFTLLVGENGSGKTSVLDALAISLGIWLRELAPRNRRKPFMRNGRESDLRRFVRDEGDRKSVEYAKTFRVQAESCVQGFSYDWFCHFNPASKQLVFSAESSIERMTISERILALLRDPETRFPLFASYGALNGRFADSPENYKVVLDGPVWRWAAYEDALGDSIMPTTLKDWFLRETIAAGARNGRRRPGFEAMKSAVQSCLPDTTDLWFDADLAEIIVERDGLPLPLSSLAAGYQVMIGIVVDLAIRCIGLNPSLIGIGEEPLRDAAGPRVFQETPGVVLIDELDLHLHPRWQRRVAADLMRIFPKIQFVATSHSPQIIGELAPENIRVLMEDGSVVQPNQSFGLDSNRVLAEIMGAEPRDSRATAIISKIDAALDADDLDAAKRATDELEALVGSDDPEVVKARNATFFLEGVSE